MSCMCMDVALVLFMEETKDQVFIKGKKNLGLAELVLFSFCSILFCTFCL